MGKIFVLGCLALTLSTGECFASILKDGKPVTLQAHSVLVCTVKSIVYRRIGPDPEKDILIGLVCGETGSYTLTKDTAVFFRSAEPRIGDQLQIGLVGGSETGTDPVTWNNVDFISFEKP